MSDIISHSPSSKARRRSVAAIFWPVRSLGVDMPMGMVIALLLANTFGFFYFLARYYMGMPAAMVPVLASFGNYAFLYYYYVSRGEVNFLSPMNIIFGMYLFSAYLKALFIYTGYPENAYVRDMLLLGNDVSYIYGGTMLVSFSMVLLVLAYLLHKPSAFSAQRIPSSAKLWNTRKLWIAILALIAISFVGDVWFFTTVNFSFDGLVGLSKKRVGALEGESGEVVYGGTGYARMLIKFGALALKFYILWYFFHKKKLLSVYGLLFFVFFLIAHVPNFLNSSRSLILYDFIYIFVVRQFFAAQKIQVRSIVPLLAILIVVLTVMGQLREISAGYEDAQSEQFLNAEAILEKVAGNRNFLCIAKAGIYKEAVDDGTLPLYFGESYVRWLYSPIPRQLWPSKPNISVGLDDVIRFGVFKQSNTNIAMGGIPPSLPVELYMNFGLAGLIIGTILYGMLLKEMYTYVANRLNPFLLLMYFLFILYFIIVFTGTNFNRAVVVFLTEAIPAWLVIRFIRA